MYLSVADAAMADAVERPLRERGLA